MTSPAPTLRPTAEQFANPIGYLSSPEIIAMGEKYGILKLQPPDGWRPRFALDSKGFTFHTRFQTLGELSLVNRSRDFFFEGFNNYLRMKGKRPLRSSKNKHRGRKRKHANQERIDFDGFVTLLDGSETHIFDMFVEGDLAKYSGTIPDQDLLKDLQKYSAYLEAEEKKTGSEFSLATALHSLDTFDSKSGCSICHRDGDRARTLICDGCERPFHMACLNPPLKRVPQNDWFCEDCLDWATADYGFEEDYDKIFNLEEFKKECDELQEEYIEDHFHGKKPTTKQLEREFWRLVGSSDKEDQVEVRYGADIHHEERDQVSGFPMALNPNCEISQEHYYIDHPFNLTKLPYAPGSLLNYIQDDHRNQISGMTVPWMYVGSLFSTFCWHKEDHYTLSANYCHMGAVKKWYGIPARDCDLFESLCKGVSPDYFAKQPDLMHQLVTLVSPEEVQEWQEDTPEKVHMYTVDQGPNEFVITFPKVYHAGFNCGFNVNEAVNFTMPYWVPYGEQSIREYKRVHKEGVLNYYRLMRNILETPERISSLFDPTIVKKMLGQCLESYAGAVGSAQNVLSNTKVKSLLDKLPRRDYQKAIEARERRARLPKRGRKARMTAERAQEEQEDNPDEYICHDCKSFVNFQWVEVDMLEVEKSRASNQLPTPMASPEVDSMSDFESEWSKIIEDAKKDPNEDTSSRKRALRKRKASHMTKDLEPDSREDLKRRRVVTRMMRKRARHANYGKLVLCLDCLSHELQHLTPTDVNRLVRSSVVYEETEPGEMTKDLAHVQRKYM